MNEDFGETSTEENWGTKTLPLRFSRTVDEYAIRYAGGKAKQVVRVRALLKLGTIIIGGYETDVGYPVKAFIVGSSIPDRRSFPTEEEAKAFLLTLLD